jgi:peroxiredoxin
LRAIIAHVYDKDGRAKDAHAMRMQLLQDDPGMLSELVRPIVRGFLRATHKLGEYDAVRAEATKSIGIVRGMQQKVVAESRAKYEKALAKLKSINPGALDGDGNLKQTSTKKMTKEEKDVYTNQRSLTTAEKLLASIDVYEKPLALLGKPAAAWTLETAFEDLEALDTLKGKVVVLDFFATVFDQCNFPIMRDLLKAHGEKGLAVVGVTITSSVVYADRYAIDEDMKHKAEPGAQLYYAARLASEDSPADGEYILEESAYRLREQEAIKAFIENHELKWPVVMIDKDEPGPKYAQETWPHLVVIDKEGRLRYFRGGKLDRSDKEAVAALEAVLKDLLAE